MVEIFKIMNEETALRGACQASKEAWIPGSVVTAIACLILKSLVDESIPLTLIDLRQHMEVRPEQASLFRFLPAVTGLLIAPSVGLLVDRWGTKSILNKMLILMIVGSLAMALSNSLNSLILGLLLLGLGQMPTLVIGYTLLTKAAANAKQLGIYVALWGVVTNLTYLAMPPIVSRILAATNRSWIAISAIICALSMILLFLNQILANNQICLDVNASTAQWGWTLTLGIFFSLTTAIPVFHALTPKFTPILVVADAVVVARLIRIVFCSSSIAQQLSFLFKPSFQTAMLAVMAMYLVDWSYYSERFITLRFSLPLEHTINWLIPANIMGLFGSFVFGILSLRLGSKVTATVSALC